MNLFAETGFTVILHVPASPARSVPPVRRMWHVFDGPQITGSFQITGGMQSKYAVSGAVPLQSYKYKYHRTHLPSHTMSYTTFHMPSVKFVAGLKKALLIAICYKDSTPGGPATLDVSQGLLSIKKLLIGMNNV